MSDSEHSPSTKHGRVYLDCTHTYQSAAHNGIQRVVRNLAREARHVAPELALTCVPVVRRGKAYYRIDHELQSTPGREFFWDKVQARYVAIMSWLLKAVPIPSLRRYLLPKPGHRGIFNLPYRASLKLQDWIRALRTRLGSRSVPLVRFQAGDSLMIMEPCSYHDDWHTLDQLREQGVHVGLLVYDLIPLSHPQFCDRRYSATFKNWLEETASRTEFFVSISQTVSHTIEAYLRDSENPRRGDSSQFASFRLGADLDLTSPQGTVRSEVKQAFPAQAGVQSYLLVATIEPRKNHPFLLDAFEQAWERGSPAHLILVGRVGWMCQDIVARIQQHPEFGKRLFWFKDASDTELQFCYSHASALAYPSVTEGFGLPLVEALSHRLLVLASDIPVHREVGQDYCAYFNLQQPHELADMICRRDQDPGAIKVRSAADYDIADWRQSCREFLTVIAAQLDRLNRSSKASEGRPQRTHPSYRQAA